MVSAHSTQRAAIAAATKLAIEAQRDNDCDDWTECVALMSGDTLQITAHRDRKRTTHKLVAGWVRDGMIHCSRTIADAVHSGR